MTQSHPATFLKGRSRAERESAASPKVRIHGAAGWLERLADSPWFAYASILLIQAKMLWEIWLYRDITNGDTASYYRSAVAWAENFNVDPIFSPLYTVVWGSMQWFTPGGAYEATIVHRVIIVLAAAAIVLAVLRKLLPGGIAWVLALWWVLMPVTFDTVYEVHLFAVLPTLAAVLVALSWDGLAMRATVLAILAASGLLVRNELLVAVPVWAAIWIGYELWRRRHRVVELRLSKRRLAALGAPILVAALVIALLAPSNFGGDTQAGPARKQSLILCQHYLVSANQRNYVPEGLNPNKPFSCRKLMQQDFGHPFPTWSEAIRANPGAISEHVLWNARLIPQSVQLMLFDQISGSERMNPDLVPVVINSPLALFGLLAVGVFLIAGAWVLWRDRRRWWDQWLRERAWGWTALGCLAVAAIVVMLTVRPRPSYLFNFNVLLLAAIGMSAFVLGSRWPSLARARVAIPVVALVVLVAVPSRYSENYETPQAGQDRPLLRMLDRMEPFQDEIANRVTHLLAPEFAGEACAYLVPQSPCRGVPLVTATGSLEKGASLPGLTKDLRGNLIYADESVIGSPTVRDLLVRLDNKGWNPLGPSPSSGAGWTLLLRPDSLPPYHRLRTTAGAGPRV